MFSAYFWDCYNKLSSTKVARVTSASGTCLRHPGASVRIPAVVHVEWKLKSGVRRLCFSIPQDQYEGCMPAYFRFLTVMAFNVFLKEKVRALWVCDVCLQ